jgi:hypothetical protein
LGLPGFVLLAFLDLYLINLDEFNGEMT